MLRRRVSVTVSTGVTWRTSLHLHRAVLSAGQTLEIDLNATQAAVRAGYSKKTARQTGTENLSKPYIAEVIEAAITERSERTELTQDMVINELRKIGFADIRKLVSWGERPILEDLDEDDDLRVYPVKLVASENIDDDTAAAVSEVSLTAQGVKVKLYDKQRALVNLGKHVGCFPTRLEHGGIGGGPIEAVVELSPKEFARRALFLLAEAQEEAKRQQDQDVESEAS